MGGANWSAQRGASEVLTILPLLLFSQPGLATGQKSLRWHQTTGQYMRFREGLGRRPSWGTCGYSWGGALSLPHQWPQAPVCLQKLGAAIRPRHFNSFHKSFTWCESQFRTIAAFKDSIFSTRLYTAVFINFSFLHFHTWSYYRDVPKNGPQCGSHSSFNTWRHKIIMYVSEKIDFISKSGSPDSNIKFLPMMIAAIRASKLSLKMAFNC